LQAQVIKTWPKLYPTWKNVTCQSSCRLPDPLSYVWYQNEVNIDRKESSIEKYFDQTDGISCAVKGYEKLPSPPVCVGDQTCNTVTYTSRSICALKGSSVDISCIYSHTHPAVSKFWFSPERSHQWQHRSHPEDLRTDSHYAGRVEVIETERGRSTLRIRDLTERDSAEYHFKFKSQSFEWKNSLPGTTLSVTALQVKVSRIISVQQTQTEAELKCQSSCSPAGRLSSDANPAANYTWYKEDDDSAKASGQNFIITDFRPEHSGSYYCEAQNTRGRRSSTSHHLTVVTGKSIIIQNIIRLTLVVLMLIPLLLVNLWMSKKKPWRSTAESNELMETMEMQSNHKQDSADGNRK
ncbi:junctional adhesion molecule C-like, partial [Pundamilia nyererei]|uniref:Junctional adhesion molecule C-like n=1 Tax=Pundamilia nyererei TaxID=303518 RepID=A0A9Y6J8T5_9CICH